MTGAPAAFVAGAGPAGLTIARLLALKGWRVVVASEDRPGAERLELLAPAAMPTISALGLEPLLHDAAFARRCLGIRRPQQSTPYEDFLGHPRREGYVVHRARFDAKLRDEALAAGAKIFAMRVVGVDADAVRVRTHEGVLRRWPVEGVLVDATGRASAIARRRGASTIAREHILAEPVDENDAAPKDDGSPWLDFWAGDADWSYRIRGPEGRVETWRFRRLRRAARGAHCVNASAGLLSPAAGAGWIAIGDAAMTVEPIASQGLFNALSSARIAAGLLLSKEGLTTTTASAWSAAVAATFQHSRRGRAQLIAYCRPQPVGFEQKGPL